MDGGTRYRTVWLVVCKSGRAIAVTLFKVKADAECHIADKVCRCKGLHFVVLGSVEYQEPETA